MGEIPKVLGENYISLRYAGKENKNELHMTPLFLSCKFQAATLKKTPLQQHIQFEQ
jgi:hypothetical protein